MVTGVLPAPPTVRLPTEITGTGAFTGRAAARCNAVPARQAAEAGASKIDQAGGPRRPHKNTEAAPRAGARRAPRRPAPMRPPRAPVRPASAARRGGPGGRAAAAAAPWGP